MPPGIHRPPDENKLQQPRLIHATKAVFDILFLPVSKYEKLISSPPESRFRRPSRQVADQISDVILDEFLARDPKPKVACETPAPPAKVVTSRGEKSKSEAYIDLIGIAM